MLSRFSSGRFLALALVAVAGCASEPTASQQSASPPVVLGANHGLPPFLVPDAEEVAVQKKLDQLVDVVFDETPLESVFDWCSEVAGINIITNWAALESAGIEADLPITFTLKQVTLREVIALTLEHATADALLEPIDFKVRGPTVRISTNRDLMREQFKHEYDISDLLDWPEPHRVVIEHEDGRQPRITLKPFKPLVMNRDQVQDAMIEAISSAISESNYWTGQFNAHVKTLESTDAALIIKADRDDHMVVSNLINLFRQQHEAAIAANFQESAIAPLLQKADRKRMAGQREAALRLTQKALLVRPDHPVARALHQVLASAMHRSGQSDLVAAISRPTKRAVAAIAPAPWMRVIEEADEPNEQASQLLKEKLAKRISVEFKNTRFDEAIRQIATLADLSIIPLWWQLESAGVEGDIPITFKVSGMAVNDVLDILIQYAGAVALLEPLGVQLRGQHVSIGTLRAQYKRSSKRAYDITALIYWPPHGISDVDHLLNDEVESRRVLDADEEFSPVAIDALPTMEWLPMLVQDTIARQSDWLAYGGETASISTLPGQLLVTAPDEFHEEIITLLEHLHRQMHQKLVDKLSDTEIAPQIAAARKLMVEGQYELAQKQLDEALIVKPDHTQAVAMRKTLTDILARQLLASPTRKGEG